MPTLGTGERFARVALVKRRAAFGAERGHRDPVAAEFERIDRHERQSTIVNHQGVKRPNVRFPACAKRLAYEYSQVYPLK